MISKTNPALARSAWWAARGALAACVLAASTACSVDKILDVKDPDVATPSTITGATALPTLLGGAVSAFHAAYIGTGDANESSGQIGYSGLLSDELRSSDTYPTRNEVDRRSIQLDNGSNESQFILLSQARAAADLAEQSYDQYGAGLAGRALAYALDGYATVLFGENYCSGVPFSKLPASGIPEYGQPLTTQQIFGRAIGKFNAALASTGINGTYKNLALVGKARAQLDSGDFAGAAATAALVTDTNFVYNIESSITTSGQYNGMYTFNQNVQRLTLVDSEGINGLDYLSANDPRVVWEDAGETGFDNETELYLQGKYPARTSPAVLASWTEAQLIIAEANLAANYATPTTGTLAILNKLRAKIGLGPLAPAVGATAQQNQLFRERAFWLYLTSHRLGDMRRLIRQYNRQPESVFPTGPFFKGSTYGPDLNMPVPLVEENNPNFHGCINRNA